MASVQQHCMKIGSTVPVLWVSSSVQKLDNFSDGVWEWVGLGCILGLGMVCWWMGAQIQAFAACI